MLQCSSFQQSADRGDGRLRNKSTLRSGVDQKFKIVIGSLKISKMCSYCSEESEPYTKLRKLTPVGVQEEVEELSKSSTMAIAGVKS